MADRYVWSGATGSGSGADWANAHTTFQAAITASTAGDRFFVAHDHAQSQGTSVSLNFKGTTAAPDTVFCVDRAGSVPPVAADLRTTATVTVTVTTAQISIFTSGLYIYGVSFIGGTGANPQSITIVGLGRLTFQDCAFKLNDTTITSRINVSNNSNGFVEWINCSVAFGHVSHALTANNGFLWRDTATPILGAIIPTTLFALNSTGTQVTEIRNLDLSQLGAGCTIVTPANNQASDFRLVNCKLDASVTVSTTPAAAASLGVNVLGSNSTNNAQRNERYAYQGTLTTETTIKRTAGASDGVTAYSWKVTTTANAMKAFPFVLFEGALWNVDTGSAKTLTVHILTDNVTLTDSEIWLEVDYLGSSGTPLGTGINDAFATLLSGDANQASDSAEAWTTTGLATPVKQKLEVTFTPQMVGRIRWRVKVAKPSTTVYVCPKADLS